ncbi:DUF2249 domain-containing protein [Bacillus sp. FJAT-29937]|uniref:DUF2249 domain-containing protein n=1 Tax=Bacillus sp. FJAT-29937 TaxID=1720553 RepID=UPI00082C4214|nr:DUF2249 domain-containing protein [Bacillus sp. FJAT-29937]
MIEFAQTVIAPDFPPREKHPTIFKAFDSLQTGEFMLLVNDHDPKPLQYQFMIERENGFTWEYLEEGPDLWKVAIGRK